jgi:hypothetical protein
VKFYNRSVLKAISAWLIVFFFFPPLSAAPPEKTEFRRSWGVGLGMIGPLVRKGFKKDYSLEGHYFFGETGDDDLSAHVFFGMRGYRHFRTDRRLQLFAGLEADYVLGETRIQKSTGYLTGGFAGIEYYLTRRLSLGLDLGPYYVWLKEKDFGNSGGGVDFVLNTFLNFYIF